MVAAEQNLFVATGELFHMGEEEHKGGPAFGVGLVTHLGIIIAAYVVTASVTGDTELLPVFAMLAAAIFGAPIGLGVAALVKRRFSETTPAEDMEE